MMRTALILAALLPLTLVGCGGDEPPPPMTYAALHYEYLPKLRLNVGSVDVTDHSAPIGPQDVAALSPAIPAQVLAQMLQDRIVAAGVSGYAHAVIDQASIVREPNGTMDGQLGVHLEIDSPSGSRLGYLEAHVARQHLLGPDQEDDRTSLYNLTRQMMDDMNVQLALELHQNLAAWMVSGDGTPAPVAAQPLPPPEPPPAPVPPAAAEQAPAPPPPPPPPPENGYRDPATLAPPAAVAQPAAPAEPTPPPQMSPPPGFLTPPPGAAPAPPQTIPPGYGPPPTQGNGY